MAEIQAETHGRPVAVPFRGCVYCGTYVPHGIIFRARKVTAEPNVSACISAIPGRMSVIFTLLKILFENSISFILQTFSHSHFENDYLTWYCDKT
jgi:hypothetical protein